MNAGQRALAVVAVTMVVLIGCGGGSSNSSGSNSTRSSGSEPSASQSSPGAQSASPSGGGLTGLGLPSVQCVQAAAAYGRAAAAAAQAFSPDTSNLQSAVDDLRNFDSNAPQDVKADLATVVQAYSDFAQAVKDAGYDPSSGQPPTADQAQKLEDANSKLQTADVKDAADRVTNWFQTNCR